MKTREDILRERKVKWVEDVYNNYTTDIENIYSKLRESNFHTHFFENYSDAEDVKEYLKERGFTVSEVFQDFWRNEERNYIEISL